ncbi:MAG: hypothetical protein GY947_09055 [Rhodobacteraceae bacterium]|nr:hypothetical protein [Paracoccaceae bacterium]
MCNQSVEAAECDIDGALGAAFGIRKGTIFDKLRQAGKRLPRGVADDVAYLEAVRKRTAHPRRRGLMDAKRVAEVRDHSLKTLGKVDVARDKARERINWLGVLVINLMLFGVVYYALLRWLGAV